MPNCGTPQICYGQAYYDFSLCTCRCNFGASLLSFQPFYCDFGTVISTTSSGIIGTGTVSRKLRNILLK